MSGSATCKRCGEELPTPAKLQKHLDRVHDGAPNRGPRARAARLALLVAAAVVVVAVGVLVLDDDPADTRAENLERFGVADDPLLGDPDAPVVLVAFESPHCSACQSFHNSILPRIQERYVDTGQVAYYYVQATINHPSDLDGSVAQECANHVGGASAFWNLTGALYARPDIYATPDYPAYLEGLAEHEGVDAGDLLDCYHDRATEALVARDYRVGRDVGVLGTPTFFLFGAEGEAVSPPAGNVEAAIVGLLDP